MQSSYVVYKFQESFMKLSFGDVERGVCMVVWNFMVPQFVYRSIYGINYYGALQIEKGNPLWSTLWMDKRTGRGT